MLLNYFSISKGKYIILLAHFLLEKWAGLDGLSFTGCLSPWQIPVHVETV